MRKQTQKAGKKHTPQRPDAETMLIEERRQHILSIVQNEGRAVVGELSEKLGISRITIRKDLDSLQARGLIQRSHGGALPASTGAMFDPSLQVKQKQHLEQKQRIAAAAIRQIQDGQCIILDSGTTTTMIAQALKRFTRLTVITNAINIAAELTTTDFDVILTGGTVRKNSFSLVGPLAEDVLSEMHADILFLGVDGFDVEAGISTPNFLESRVNRAMVKAAKKVIAVCDSTKFNRRSLSLIIPPSAVHQVITDTDAPAEMVEALRNQHVDVLLV